jgi:hypothetical protein
MKGMKLSKTSWLILSAGVFTVVLAGLGVTRTGQMKEQNKLDEELGMYTSILEKSQAIPLETQLGDLQEKLKESESQLAEAKDRLRQTVLSVDVTDNFFQIANYCQVIVMNLNTSSISKIAINDVSFSTISITASVTGELSSLIDFIISLNKGYTTGFVRSAQLSVEDTSGDTSAAKATINMVIYSYEGS